MTKGHLFVYPMTRFNEKNRLCAVLFLRLKFINVKIGSIFHANVVLLFFYFVRHNMTTSHF